MQVRRILSNNPDIPLFTKGESMLHQAAVAGHTEVAQLLIDFKAPLNHRNKDGQTPAHVAADAGYAELVETLWRAGADLEQHAADGSTPVLAASRKGHAAVIKILQMAGADLDSIGENGKTAMLVSAANGATSVIEVLLKVSTSYIKRSRLRHTNSNGETPYYVAAAGGSVQLDIRGDGGTGSYCSCTAF